MIRSRARRRFVAWLAFAALWLIVAAPVVSQCLAGPSVDMAMAMHCDGAMDHGGHGGMPDPLAPSMDKCGYCGLLGHSPVLGSVPWLPPLPLSCPARLEAVFPAMPPARLQVLAAAPRGPPVRLNA